MQAVDWQGVVTLTVDVSGVPQPQGSARAFVRGRRAIVTSDNPQLHSWRDLVRYAAGVEARRVGWQVIAPPQPVLVALTFRLPRPKSVPKSRIRPTSRPDLDKLVRGILDALSGIAYHDDNQVCLVTATKEWPGPGEAPGVRVSVERMA